MVYQRSSSLTTVSPLLSHRPLSLVMEGSPRFQSLIVREKTVFTNLKKQILEEPSVHLEIRFLGQCSECFSLLHLKISEIFLARSHMHMHARTHTHTHTHYSDLTRIVTILTTQDLALCVAQQHHWGACYTYSISGPTPDPLNQNLPFNKISRCFLCSNILRI